MTKRTCSVAECNNPHQARGYCNMHYKRWRKHNGQAPIAKRATTIEELRARGNQQGDCLLWAGAKNADGYGRSWDGEKVVLAHRLAWELSYGPIPKGIQIDHKCWQPACIHVDHLRPVTQSENQSYRSGPASSNKSSGIRNVSKSGSRWQVQVRKDGVLHTFGSYPTIEEAASVAERARQKLFGKHAGRG